jgi:probable rRNA maturation factor
MSKHPELPPNENLDDLDEDNDVEDLPDEDEVEDELVLTSPGAGGARRAIRWQLWPALRTRVSRDALRLLGRRLRRAAPRVGVTLDDLPGITVSLVDDAEIQRLNLAHMGKDKPTDVLSFPGRPPGDDGELAAMGVPLGDIVLSWDAVQRQSAARLSVDASGLELANAALDEATVLAIHGLCHLLGHDHALRHEARQMHRRELRGLRAARVTDIPRPYGLRSTRS